MNSICYYVASVSGPCDFSSSSNKNFESFDSCLIDVENRVCSWLDKHPDYNVIGEYKSHFCDYVHQYCLRYLDQQYSIIHIKVELRYFDSI